MDFIIGLSVLSNRKGKNYNFILVIINWFKKMIYYNSEKIIVNALQLVKVIFNMVIWLYNLFNSIVSNKGLLFIFKFWLLLCYFFAIKQRLFTAFYL